MKRRTVISLICAITLLFGSVISHGDTFSSIGASAGASRRLEQYLISGEKAVEALIFRLSALRSFHGSGDVSTETEDPVLYDAPKTGVVCTEGTLNIRERESVLSDVVAIAYQQKQVTVYGEHKVRGKLWYKVDYEGVSGYASADYVKFGDEAVIYFTELHELMKNSSIMPDPISIPKDEELSGLDSETRNKLIKALKEANYSLTTDYPKQQADENYLNMYFVLVYIIENYQRALDISSAYQLQQVYSEVERAVRTVGLLRENLTDATGTTDTEFVKQVEEAIQARNAKKEYTLGEQIANYAATFVDILPYVWGGASLTRGADCSGFCAQIYAHFGYMDQGSANAHAYDSTALRNVGRPVSLQEIQPGDMVCYQGHVAIYYGSGMVVHEPSIGKKCSFGSVYLAPIITIRRLIP